MNQSYCSESIKEVIKDLLKKHGKTQKDLAEYLGLSLPTIKKQLNNEDIGLERLVKMASFFQMSLWDLMSLTFENGVPATKISQSQEKFLSSRFIYTKILKSLFCSLTFDEICSRYSLSESQLTSYLKELEKHSFISFRGNEDLRLKVRWPLQYDKPTTYSMARFKKWTEVTMSRILSDPSCYNQTLFRFEYYCTKQTAEEMRLELKELVQKYKKHAAVDKKSQPKDNLDYYSLVTAQGAFSGWDWIKDDRP